MVLLLASIVLGTWVTRVTWVARVTQVTRLTIFSRGLLLLSVRF